jgi:hypothetical protein
MNHEPRPLLALSISPSLLIPLSPNCFRMATDPLAEISGIKPKRYLKDGEQVEVQSKSSSVLRRSEWVPSSDTEAKLQQQHVRREARRRSLLLQMSCKHISWNVFIIFTDWNEQGWTFAGKSHPIDARTCKHLKELLGAEVRIYSHAMLLILTDAPVRESAPCVEEPSTTRRWQNTWLFV